MSSFDQLGGSSHGHSRKANRAEEAAGGGGGRGKKKGGAKTKLSKAGKAAGSRSHADDRSSQSDAAQDDGYVPEHIRLEAEKEAKRLAWQRKHDGEASSDGGDESGEGEEGEGGDDSDDSGDASLASGSSSSSAASSALVPLKLAMWDFGQVGMRALSAAPRPPDVAIVVGDLSGMSRVAIDSIRCGAHFMRTSR